MEISRKTKVTDENPAIFVHQNVAWLDVPMNNTGRVDVLQTTYEIVKNGQHVALLVLNGVSDVQEVLERGLLVCHHNEQVTRLLLGGLRLYQFDQLTGE